MERLYQNRKWLEQKYLKENLTSRKIAKMCGVTSITWFVRKFGLKKNNNPIKSQIGKLPKWKCAYLAGCIDTDGCIHVKAKDDLTGKGEVEVANTNLHFLQNLQGMINGGYLGMYKRRKHYLWCHRLCFRINECRDLLPQIIPFLVIKKEKAEVLLQRIQENH